MKDYLEVLVLTQPTAFMGVCLLGEGGGWRVLRRGSRVTSRGSRVTSRGSQKISKFKKFKLKKKRDE